MLKTKLPTAIQILNIRTFSGTIHMALNNMPIKTTVCFQETLDKTNLEDWSVGSKVNLERCMKADGRFDGHIVQGHVDCSLLMAFTVPISSIIPVNIIFYDLN